MSSNGIESVLEDARTLGFLGPGPVGEHLAHSEAFARCVGESPGRILDLGSGGGVPGLVLAGIFPESEVLLVDSSRRRCDHLERSISRLGLVNCQVECHSAEEAGRDPSLRGQFDAVVARGFGPPAMVVECAAPLTVVGGIIVASEPPGTTGARWNREALPELGLEIDAIVEGPPGFVIMRRIGECPDRYPRRPGIPRRRPLFN